ncbi:MAG: 2,3-bisphosphoglycerate-dependent phosphoglycerate mutase [Solirubrobacteraceae bacterium]|nr:2,3-bisphosphoglycerate-dependent phosphoglycerate mutase [Solirubrobacteraceae bacterium]
MTARRLYIVRHGQTESSMRMIYSGQTDVALTETGRSQARNAGEQLSGIGVDAIISSPLSRALDTAVTIGKATGVDVRVDDRLIEVDYGAFEGLDRPQARERFGDAFEAWRNDPFGATIPGTEQLGDALVRARAATEDALESAQLPVLVGHQGILRIVLIALGRLAPEDYFKQRLTEATPIAIDDPQIADH